MPGEPGFFLCGTVLLIGQERNAGVLFATNITINIARSTALLNFREYKFLSGESSAP